MFAIKSLSKLVSRTALKQPKSVNQFLKPAAGFYSSASGSSSTPISSSASTAASTAQPALQAAAGSNPDINDDGSPKATNIVWSDLLSATERKNIFDNAPYNNHKGACVWLTGLSGSGKSTIGAALEVELLTRGVRSYRLDGDNVRFGLNKDLGFSEEDREENLRRIGEVSSLYADAGIVAVTAFISPYRRSRDHAREICRTLGYNFVEVHVHCPLEVAESRDPKGLYKKARAGEITNMTGIDDPFEEPLTPEVKLNTHLMSVDESVETVVDYLKQQYIVDIGQ